jgi:Family of unknown function (DUF6454)
VWFTGEKGPTDFIKGRFGRSFWMKRAIRAGTLLATCCIATRNTVADDRTLIGDRVTRLTRESAWTLVESLPIKFRTYHPQGMVKIGDTLFVSSVEVRVPTRRLPASPEGFDRDTGEGVAHLFKIDRGGNLVADLTLGEGTLYHPSGLDYDGTNIWVAVAEYRPNSRSIMYRVDPTTLKASEIFRVDDHLGAVVRDTDDQTLHGVSWGSRRFYRWLMDRRGNVTNAGARLETLRTLNSSHYVDYQDCKYAGRHRMLCTGVSELRPMPDAPPFRLGGIELVDLRDGRPVHQVPLLLWTPSGLDLTHNPGWFEPTATGLRGYFMPEDDASTVYIYDVVVR